MNKTNNRLPGIADELKSQDYNLKKFNDREILIKGIPTISFFMFFVLSLVGISFIVVGILSLTFENPEVISGILFTAAGIFLILLPVYNHYTKKGHEIYINKQDKNLVLKTISVFPKQQTIHFDEIKALILRKWITNAFVDDTSESSTIQNYSILIDLKNSNTALIHFVRKNSHTEEFISYFMDYLAEFMNIEIRHIAEE